MHASTEEESQPKPLLETDSATVRFCGDSGDGMQLAGTQLTNTSALAGNDVATFPDFPAEIRAPRGTKAGVSGFQIHFASNEIFTPGDQVDALVAMNPAALVTNLRDLVPGGILIVNSDAFDEKRPGPGRLQDQSPGGRQPRRLPGLPGRHDPAHAAGGRGARPEHRRKPIAAATFSPWAWSSGSTTGSLESDLAVTSTRSSASRPDIAEANRRALHAGYNYGETTEAFASHYHVDPRPGLPPGTYRNITGNQAAGLGPDDGRQAQRLRAVLRQLPDHAGQRHPARACRGTRISACAPSRPKTKSPRVTSAIGAAFGGAMGVDRSSGPGIALKTGGHGPGRDDRVAAVDHQRAAGGPSTGLPTKTEQADLLQAMFGRNGECPMPVLAARSPADCFDVAHEAWRIATRYMTPVIVLTDGYMANGSEPWRIPGHQRAGADPGRASAGHAQRRDLPALRPQRTAGPALGPSRHARPDAPHRRPGEAGCHRQRELRPGQPPAHGRAAGQEDRQHRPGYSASTSGRAGRGQAAGGELGRHLRLRGHGRQPPASGGPCRGPRPSRVTSIRCRPTWASCSNVISGSWSPN